MALLMTGSTRTSTLRILVTIPSRLPTMCTVHIVMYSSAKIWMSRVPSWSILVMGRGKFITGTSWWALWRPKSLASRLFAQPFVQVQIKKDTKAPRHWPLWGESTGDRWIPFTKGQWRRKCFHLMASSCGHRHCSLTGYLMVLLVSPRYWWLGARLWYCLHSRDTTPPYTEACISSS